MHDIVIKLINHAGDTCQHTCGRQSATNKAGCECQTTTHLTCW